MEEQTDIRIKSLRLLPPLQKKKTLTKSSFNCIKKEICEKKKK